MGAIIELKNVTFSAQKRELVSELNYCFEEGKTTALIGPSGCGKSTMLKLAAGLLPPSEGEALFRGKNIARMNRAENLEFRREGAFVFQDSALWANQNLFQTLELPLQAHFPSMQRADRVRRIQEVADIVGYKKSLDVRPSQLSMGEQKLLAFARALICRPRLLFLDEYTESLDESASNRLIDITRKLRGDGVTIIMISHDFRIINDLADLVALIAGGRIHMKLTKEQMAQDKDMRRYIEEGMAS